MPNKARHIKTAKPRFTRPSSIQRGYDNAHHKMRRQLLAERPLCEVVGEGCTGWSEEAHHLTYPARSLNDYLAVCRNCHRQLEGEK